MISVSLCFDILGMMLMLCFSAHCEECFQAFTLYTLPLHAGRKLGMCIHSRPISSLCDCLGQLAKYMNKYTRQIARYMDNGWVCFLVSESSGLQ